MSSVLEEVAKLLKGITSLTEEDEKQIMGVASCLPMPMESREGLSRLIHQHAKKKTKGEAT